MHRDTAAETDTSVPANDTPPANDNSTPDDRLPWENGWLPCDALNTEGYS